MYDLAIVGAGPIGLETAILAKRAGLRYVVLEKGTIVNAIQGYPTYMTFFTTADRLEIGGHPFVTATDKPTRKEALDYYRKVVQNEDLNVQTFSEVTAISKAPGGFQLQVRRDRREETTVAARKLVMATGYFDNPKRLGVPGEDLPHVSHYYTEAHPFFRRNVTIVGAGSSAADAALDLFRGGANVTMVHRGDDFRHSLKYWVRPNLENRVKEGSIKLHLNTVVQEITPEEVIASQDGNEVRIPSHQVFLLTGYYAPADLLRDVGVRFNEESLVCELDEDSFESNVPGLYMVGSCGHGVRTSDVFIENGIVHARAAMDDIVKKLQPEAVSG